MISKLKKIIIPAVVVAVLVAGYFFFFKKTPGDDASLVSSATTDPTTGAVTSDPNSGANQEFLNILLNVKNIKLDDSIFSDPAFIVLHDSTIILIPDATTGRPNPFAPIGFEKASTPPVAPNKAENVQKPKN